MDNFREQAKEWAEKQLKNVETDKGDLLEMMMFGSIGYRIDPEGNIKKLSREEFNSILQKEKFNILTTTIEQITGHFNSLYKDVFVKYENNNFIIEGSDEENMLKIKCEIETMLEFSRKKD